MIPAGQSLTLRCQFCQTWNRVDGTRAAERPKCGKCARFILLDRPFTLFEDTFERTIRESELPVLVDFYADWCGPCKMMAPAVDELAARHAGNALVAKLNTDHAPNTSGAFNIRGIPTSIVFKGGQEVARQSGALPLSGLEQLLQQARGNAA
ncbi:MAG: thioredoxin [Gemmatimonadaceae bacterium]|nr:thioredoxin [Gemmatimonadaceae bacterium]